MSSLHRLLPALALCTLAACTEPEKAPGSVWVDYSTVIADGQPFTWLFSIDGAHAKAVSSSVTGSVRVDSLSAGSHTLVVSGLPAACTTGSDERTIEIPAGDTLHIGLAVKCSRTTGDIRVNVTTTGSELDPNGYSVSMDGVLVGGTQAFSPTPVNVLKVAPGTHSISLSGVASNCTVSGGPTFPAVVTAGNLTTVPIGVTCVAVSGTLRVTTTTNGLPADRDLNGYRITVNGVPSFFIGSSGVTTMTLTGGAYTISLSDVEPNCTSPALSQAATVPVGGTVDVAFELNCGAYPATTPGTTVADPANDTLPNLANAPTPSFDIIELATGYASGFMTVTLKFSKPIGSNAFIGLVDLDLDENKATGVSPLANQYGGTLAQGVDGTIFFMVSSTPSATYYPSNGAEGPIRIIAGGDSVRLWIPNDRINDDGNVTVSAIVGPNDRPTDFIPGGAAPIVSHRPAAVPAAIRAAAVDRAEPQRQRISPWKPE